MLLLRAVAGLLLLASALSLPVGVFAQQTLGRINGTVSDSSGAVVGNTAVAVTNNQTGSTRRVSTQNNGAYMVQDLPIGTYSLSFSHDGFDTSEFSLYSGTSRPLGNTECAAQDRHSQHVHRGNGNAAA